mgnify:CR=1 FL=1
MKIKRLLLLLALPLLVASCTSYKNVPYLQNPEAVNDFEETLPLYDAKIMPKDLLSITVNTTDPKAATPFNLTVQTPINAALTNISTTTQPTMQQYLVNNKGEIDFPVIGRLEVGGLTKNEAEDLIRERLKPYLKESPIVTVRMANYKISVLGEVARPGSFTIGNEKVNVLEALAMAGDMTVYGVRSEVAVTREVDGVRTIEYLDLTSTDIFNSPAFYLQQNDVVYVKPNKYKAQTGEISQNRNFYLSLVGTAISVATLIVTLTK